MGYQEREQRQFQGLYNTRTGAAAPNWSASEVVNIDFSYQSMRGRPPMERVREITPGHCAVLYRGLEVSIGDAASTTFGMGTADTRDMWMRLYLTDLETEYFVEHAVGTRWFIAGSPGDSTDFGSGAGTGENGGWALMLHHSSQGVLTLTMHTVRGSIATPESVSVVGLEAYEPSDTLCVEYEYDKTANSGTLEVFVNKAASPALTATTAFTQTIAKTSGNHQIQLGAFARLNSPDDTLYNFRGSIGEMLWVQWNSDAIARTYMRWQAAPAPFCALKSVDSRAVLDPSLSTNVIVLLSHSGYGTKTYSQSSSNFALEHYSKPPTIVSNRLKIEPGEATVIAMPYAGVDNESTIRGTIVGFQVDQCESGAQILWGGTADGLDTRWYLSTIGSGPTYTLRMNFRVPESTPSPPFVSNVQNFNIATGLSIGTTYRVAIFEYCELLVSNRAASVQTWVKAGGTWTAGGTTTYLFPKDELGARVPWNQSVIFGNHTRLPYKATIQFDDYRVHDALDAMPASGPDVAAIDTYPSGAGAWGSTTTTSFDFSSAAHVATETEEYGERFVEAVDNKTGVAVCVPWRRYPRNPYTTIGHIDGGMQTPTFGCSVSVANEGSSIVETLDVHKSGGTWRYDMQDNSECALSGYAMYGVPQTRLHSVDVKDRTYVFGQGVSPYKIYACEQGGVGHYPPLVSATVSAGTSTGGGGGAGGLVAGRYWYKFSLYNRKTGEESPLTSEAWHVTLGASNDQAVIQLHFATMTRQQDYDAINLYRRSQNGSVYYLEQQAALPRKYVYDASQYSTLISTMAESTLLLQRVEEVDNTPPPDYTAAVYSGRSLVVGGGGAHPGWVYYSKTNLVESFPALQVWQLNDDDSDAVVAIHTMFGRLVILKKRSVWVGRDDAPLTGETPQLMHEGRGATGAAASVLADNRLFFVSSDRCVYVTDGIELADVSSPSIRKTMEDLTDYQLQRAQLSHYPQKKQVWMSVPVDPGTYMRNAITSPALPVETALHEWNVQAVEIYIFDYEMSRWSKYEIAHSSISTAQIVGGLGGETTYVATPSRVYQLGSGVEGVDGLPPSKQTHYSAINPFDSLTPARRFNDFSNTLITAGWQMAFPGGYINTNEYEAIGVPVTPGTDQAFAGSPNLGPWTNLTAPWYQENTQYAVQSWPTEVLWYGSFTQDVTRSEMWLRAPVVPAIPFAAVESVWAVFGYQQRRYSSQLWTPQGEGYDYVFSGLSYVIDADIPSADFTANMKMFIDARVDPVSTYTYNSSQYPDVSHSFRGRGRRYMFKFQSWLQKFEIQRVISRFRVRGARRVR